MDDKTILAQIANSPALLDAVRKVIDKQFEVTGLSMEMPNEQLGTVVRAKLGGQLLIELAFREIARYKTPAKEPDKINQAR